MQYLQAECFHNFIAEIGKSIYKRSSNVEYAVTIAMYIILIQDGYGGPEQAEKNERLSSIDVVLLVRLDSTVYGQDNEDHNSIF